MSQKRAKGDDGDVVDKDHVLALELRVQDLESELERLQKELAEMKAQKDARASSAASPSAKEGDWVDVLVVWDGEDGGPKLRAVAPAACRPQTNQALDTIWDYDGSRDSPYRRPPGVKIKAYMRGERRPCATLFRARLQSAADVDEGEPDFDKDNERFNMPDV